MKELEIGRLICAAMRFANLRHAVKQGQNFMLPDRDYSSLLADLRFLRERSTELDMAVTADAAASLEAVFVDCAARIPPGFVTFSVVDALRLIGHCANLTQPIGVEIGSRLAFIVPPSKATYFNQPEPLFGVVVASQFSSDAAWEIEEAGRCLALARDTACVFHLMRTMEVALEALRLCLQLPEPLKPQDKAWGTVLGNYRKAMAARDNSQSTLQWKSEEDKEFFAEVYASLDAVKNAWRNKTMHVEKSYTTPQAEHVFAVVKGFMEKVASRLDEDGLPLA